MPPLYAIFVDGHFWKALAHKESAELMARGFHGRGVVVVYQPEVS